MQFGEIDLAVVLDAELEPDVAVSGADLALAGDDFAVGLRDVPEHAIAVAAGRVFVHQGGDEGVRRLRWFVQSGPSISRNVRIASRGERQHVRTGAKIAFHLLGDAT